MTDYQSIRQSLLSHLAGCDEGSEDYTNCLKQLETLNKAEAAQLQPEPPEEKGAKAWFEKHSDSLIKVGGTFGSIILLGFVESKFDVIFRSKASKYL
jgi:hypothetical protein